MIKENRKAKNQGKFQTEATRGKQPFRFLNLAQPSQWCVCSALRSDAVPMLARPPHWGAPFFVVLLIVVFVVVAAGGVSYVLQNKETKHRAISCPDFPTSECSLLEGNRNSSSTAEIRN